MKMAIKIKSICTILILVLMHVRTLGAQELGSAKPSVNSSVNSSERAPLADRLMVEITNLLESKAYYKPNNTVLDSRSRLFSNKVLALLYLSAVQEQYSRFANVFGKLEENRELRLLHDAHHIFDEEKEIAFEAIEYVRLYYDIIPKNFQAEDEALDRIKNFVDLEKARQTLFDQVIVSLKQGGAINANAVQEEIKNKTSDIMKRLSQDSDAKRVEFLTSLVKHYSFNDDMAVVVEKMRFQVQLAHELTDANVQRVEKSLMYFYMLGDYFKDVYDSPVVLWPKWIPVRRENREFTGFLKLRFYMSKTKDFLDNVYNEQIPLRLVRSMRSLVENKQWDYLAWAISNMNKFYQSQSRWMNNESRGRFEQSMRLAEKLVREQGGVGKYKSYVPNFIAGQMRIKLQDGREFNQQNLFQIYGLQIENPDLDRDDDLGASDKSLGIPYYKRPMNPAEQRKSDCLNQRLKEMLHAPPPRSPVNPVIDYNLGCGDATDHDAIGIAKNSAYGLSLMEYKSKTIDFAAKYDFQSLRMDIVSTVDGTRIQGSRLFDTSSIRMAKVYGYTAFPIISDRFYLQMMDRTPVIAWLYVDATAEASNYFTER